MTTLSGLTAGQSAAMAFCDPPYNVPVHGFVSGLGRSHHREFVQASGELSDEDFRIFLTRGLGNVKACLKAGAVAFVCIDWRHYALLAEAARISGFSQINLCVWTKTNAGMGSLYRSQHELILVFRAGASPHQNNVDLGRHGRHRSNVWAYRGMNSFGAERADLLAAHPTVKPVAMIADAIRDVTRRKEIVIDAFLGSGSTLIAAEETGRRCFALDLDPGYVDVAVRRWEKMTGRHAVHAATGQLFTDVADRSRSDGSEGNE